MDPIDRTPTRPSDYAALTATFIIGTALLARATRDSDETIGPGEMLPMGAATFAASKALTREKVEVWVREPFVEEGADARGARHPKGSGVRYAIGELLSCPRCTGMWVALGLVALRLRAPHFGRVATTLGALSAINDVGHAAFARLTAADRPSGAP